MSITYNTEYLKACSDKLGNVVTDPYKTLEAIIHTFFDQNNINSAIFPEIGNTYCSFYEPHSSSRPTINGKKAVLLNNPEIVKYTNQIQYFIRDVKFKKHIICFTIFLFSAIKLKQEPPADNIEDSLYVYIKNFEKNQQNPFDLTIRTFAQKIIGYLAQFVSNNNANLKYEFCEYIKNTVKPDKIPEDITKKLEELVKLINDNKFNEIKINDLFRLKSTETGQEYKGLLDHLNKTQTPPQDTPDLSETKKKLENYIKSLNIPIITTQAGELHLQAILEYDEKNLSTFETLKCTEVREDILTGIEFAELTINELHTFINYRDKGYCYTYDYIALKMINERSKPKLDIEIPYEALADLLAKYYAYAASTDSLDDFLRAYDEMRNNYKDAITDKLVLINKTDIETLRTPNQPNPQEVPELFTKIYNVFKYILNPDDGLAKAIEQEDITKLCKSSIGTIFDLIGLFGYTLFSDDITVGDNADASKFSIAKNCSLILLDLFEKLNDLGLKEKLLEIRFKYTNMSGEQTTSIGTVLGKMQNTCIHGVGNEAMRYFFLALKVKNRYINSLKENISKAEVAVLTELKDYGYSKESTLETQADQKAAIEFLNDTFRDPPFIKTTPREITNTQFAYLTCIRQDKMHNYNPLACRYNVIGYTIDGEFSYLCEISSTMTYVKDQNPNSALDFLNKSGNFTIGTHSQCKDYAKGEIFTNFLQTHRNYLREMIKISYVFQKNRVPLFKVYKEYVLNICTVMSNKIKAKAQDQAQDQTRAKFLTKLYNKTQYDVINMEDTGYPVKYLTGIVIEDTEPKYRGHLYGNTTLTDDKINANAANSANANANGIKNNPKYYVTTLDNIANLKYVPDENQEKKAIIKLPETGQDITRPFHYAKLLASMLYPDMYFQECTIRISSNYKVFAEHVQRKWALFESYYHNVNGQSSQFRQLMFSSLTFKYKTQSYDKTKTKGQFSRMKFKIDNISGVEELVDAMIASDSTNLNTLIITPVNSPPQPNLKAKLISDLEAMFDYFETIDAINAPIILGKILYKFNEIKGYIAKPPPPPVYPELIKYLEDIIIDIITGMRFWMAHTIHYFKNVLPSNGYHDKVNVNRWKVEEKFRDFEIEWNEIKSEELVKNENFNIIGRKYYLIMEGVIDIILQHGYDPSTYQYHFTEIQKELYLIKYLANLDELKPSQEDNANVAQLGLPTQPKFVTIFQKSQDVIQNIIPFYNDKNEYYTEIDTKDEIFKQSDYQECIRTRFEYLLKIELVKMHEARMQQYAYFENLLANMYKNFNKEPVVRIVIKTRNLFKNFTGSHGRQMQELFDSIQDYNPANEEAQANAPADPVPYDPLQAQGLVMLDVQDREFAEALIEIIDGILAVDNQIGLLLMKAEIQEMIDTNVYDRQKLQNLKARFEMMMDLANEEDE